MINELNNGLISDKTIKKIPNNPGCYLFFNKQKNIIYIGKAKNLQKRVSNYFPATLDNYFHQQIHSVNTIITNNVKEALILEQNLIKRHQPRFNVMLKDDHFYPYLEITNDINPRYQVVRKINLAKKSEYFGPFPDGSKAREILQILERLFPLAKCKGNLGKPCFYYTINQCSGHCFQKVDSNYYENIKKEARKIFRGQTREIKKKIKTSIQKNINSLAFEIAQKEKKVLDNIDFFTSKQNTEFTDQQNCDFLGIYFKEKMISFYLLIYRYGKLVGTDENTFPVWNNKEEVCETYLYQFYYNNLIPQILYISEKFEEIEILGESLGFSPKTPQRGRKKNILDLAQKNAKQTWEKNYWNEFQQVNKDQILVEISNFLSIAPPHYFECLDISNLYTEDIVAGFLVFINGEKKLARSKLYKLNGIEQESDIARIKKACLIHYKKYHQENMPNLIIVDGAKEQVKAIKKSLKELKLEAIIIGLVKDEKHCTSKIITNDLKELDFENNEKVKNFFTNCQEQVHRYAINFHRIIHRRSTLKQK